MLTLVSRAYGFSACWLLHTLIYTVSQETKIICVITLSNFHRPW